MSDNSDFEVLRQRKEKLEKYRQEAGDPYLINHFDRENTLKEVKEYTSTDDSKKFKVAGRIITLRRHGKTAFANILDETDSMQICFRYDILGEEVYTFFKKWVDIGDWIGIEGTLFLTTTNELTICVTGFVLLSKSIRPLPDKHSGLTDVENRYRHRYIDLISNLDVRKTFLDRAKIIETLRRKMKETNTIEVETPILSGIAGGANAKPFITHHNALDQDMYLRIAEELYLKRLIVGGLNRVYEIGKCFRNEGIDSSHNPEFTLMEIYWAFADFIIMMNLVESLIKECYLSIRELQPDEYNKSKQTAYLTYNNQTIDLNEPFRIIDMSKLVGEHTDLNFDKCTDEQAREVAKLYMNQDYIKDKFEVLETDSKYEILNKVFETYVQPKLITPTFITGHPVEISPLAKRQYSKSNYTQRFELFMFGKEVANGFSELNDPIDQRQRFEDQLKKKNLGDEEAQMFDEDFIQAIETGLPPTGGVGIGIDRLVMFLTENHSIRDVILFPTLKTN